jgi:hypothetical protein
MAAHPVPHFVMFFFNLEGNTYRRRITATSSFTKISTDKLNNRVVMVREGHTQPVQTLSKEGLHTDI